MWNIFRLLELCDQYEWIMVELYNHSFHSSLALGDQLLQHTRPHGLDHSYVWMAINQSADASPENFSRLCEGDDFPELSVSWQIFVWRSNKLPSQLQL